MRPLVTPFPFAEYPAVRCPIAVQLEAVSTHRHDVPPHMVDSVTAFSKVLSLEPTRNISGTNFLASPRARRSSAVIPLRRAGASNSERLNVSEGTGTWIYNLVELAHAHDDAQVCFWTKSCRRTHTISGSPVVV